tara:strand:- start:9348 stop:11381 length:2034 start_codon:yes stop_codon:yes gene_type:complete
MVLKVFLGDLTYNTVSLATDAFPLNVGFIASYCKKLFNDKIDIQIFKYIEDIDKAINDSPPDILGLSNYCWSFNAGHEIFKMFKKVNPNGITVWGGPNFPIDMPSQEKFMKDHPEVDVYVPTDGEIGFSNVVKYCLESNLENNIDIKSFSNPLEGCISRTTDGKIHYIFTDTRIKELDEIPSPYKMGLMDKFFDGLLTPMVQTNRGCPFHCSFCTDGKDSVNVVNRFSIERVNSDLQYIAEHVPKTTHSLHISDLNFGMYPRDIDICDTLAGIQQKYEYPHFIKCTTGKNQKDKIIKAIKKLNNTLRITMSVQSLDPNVLENVRRSNISTEHMLQLYPAIKEANLETTSEVILGLPGDSYKGHLETLRHLIRAKMDEVLVHTCIMFNGSELGTPKEREKWKLKTKYRVIPKDFALLSNGRKVVETEEIVIATDKMTFEEYVELRILAFVIFVTNVAVVYDALRKFLLENQIEVFDLYYSMLKNLSKSNKIIQEIIENYKKATLDELWDDPHDIVKHYQNDGEFQKLLDNKAGINVMQFHHAKIIGDHMDLWLDFAIDSAKSVLLEKTQFTPEKIKQFESITNYCRGISFDILGKDRMQHNPKYNFGYDISKWLEDNSNLNLEEFKFQKQSEIEFILTKEQFTIVQDNIDMYGDTPAGRSQVIKRLPRKFLWRKAIVN